MRKERFVPLDYNHDLIDAVNEFMVAVKIHFYLPDLAEKRPMPTIEEMDTLLVEIVYELKRNAKPLIKY